MAQKPEARSQEKVPLPHFSKECDSSSRGLVSLTLIAKHILDRLFGSDMRALRKGSGGQKCQRWSLALNLVTLASLLE